MSPSKYLEYRRPFVILLLGICIGGAFFLFLNGRKTDALLLERDLLYYANNQKNKEVNRLQLELEKYSSHRTQFHHDDEKIQKITTGIIGEDLVEASLIKEHVDQLMEPFINKSMQWISSNPDLVSAVLHNEEVSIKKQRYLIQVKYLSFFHSTLKVWVLVQPEMKSDVVDPKSSKP